MNDKSASPRRVEAVTVSVNYSDYLRCIVDNQRQFDRWVIVTHADDAATIELCKAEGLEYHCSRRLYENGAVFHKAAALNEGMELLDRNAWWAIMDSDILLPEDFRPRLERLALEQDCLYGLSGRIVCETVAKFHLRKATQPWHGGAERAAFVIGYFQLFYGGQPHNRLPEKAGDASTYDVLFSRLFPVKKRRNLPFLGLHAGPVCENWKGRTSRPFFDDFHVEVPQAKWSIAQEIDSLNVPHPDLALAGYAPPETLKELAAICRKVVYYDHNGTLSRHPDPLWNESKAWYREQFRSERLPANVVLAGVHEAAPPVPEFDVVLFMLEAEYDFLLGALPLWIPRLRPGGVVSGTGYFPGPAADVVIAVNLLLGAPRCSPGGNGFWSVVIPAPHAFLAQRLPAPVVGESGIVYCCCGEEQVEALLISVWSLRRYWNGPIAVLHAPPESPSLRLACARLGIQYIPIPAPVAEAWDSRALLDALSWVPWPAALYVEPETVVTGPAGKLLKDLVADAGVPVLFPADADDVTAPADICFGIRREALGDALLKCTETPAGAGQSAGRYLQKAGIKRTSVVWTVSKCLRNPSKAFMVDARGVENSDDFALWASIGKDAAEWLTG